MDKIKRKFLSETALTMIVVRLLLIKIVCSMYIMAIILTRAEEKRGRGVEKERGIIGTVAACKNDTSEIRCL